MPEGWDDELSDDTLRDLAGSDVFARGVAYFGEGRVTLARDGGGNATFVVEGTHDYGTELYFEDGDLHVDCNCPHGRDGHFCKHMVAAALRWREHLGGAAAPAAAPKPEQQRAAKAAQTKARKRDELRAFVESRDAAALASLLWGWAERDRDLMAELKAWAASEQATDDPALVNKALDALLVSTRDFLPYRDTFAYAQRAGKSAKLLEQALQRSPAQALDAAEHALRRLYRVAGHADDSGGAIGDLMHDCMSIALRALARQPPPATWAERFVALLDDDPYGLWDVNAVLDAAGPEFAHHYGRVLARRWAAIEAGRGKGDANKEVSWGTSGTRTEADYERDRIRRLLTADLERRGDVGAVIEFMKRSARDELDLARTIEACERHGRQREALALAEAAHARHPKRLVIEEAVLRCWERDGWDEKAFALRKKRYWRSPRLDDYHALLRAARVAKQPLDVLRAEVEAMLVAREKAAPVAPAWASYAGRSPRRHDVTLRAQWLLAEQRTDDALSLLACDCACHPQVLLDVAAALGAPRNAEAFALIDRVARDRIARSQGRYDEALEVVAQACARLEPDAARQYLGRLKAEFKAKRNLVKGLDALRVGDEAGAV